VVLPRLIIDAIRPATPSGQPAKAAVGERVPVSAVVLRDGHDVLNARLRWRSKATGTWQTAPMRLVEPGLDYWEGTLVATEIGLHDLQIEAWTDHFATWRHDAEVKAAAGDPELEVALEQGALVLGALRRRAPKESRALIDEAIAALRRHGEDDVHTRLNVALDDHLAAVLRDVTSTDDLTRSRSVPLWVDRELGRAAAWYEFFPRSEGGLALAAKRLGPIAEMGFDVAYLPPVHPIGRAFRKGPNNTPGPVDGHDAPGSPWAIGSAEGGHTAIAPELGTIDDFDAFVDEARANGLEVALDYALQCSPDHPWVKEHPEWFHHRPDGSIAYAENPPKKYQDIYPINFWPAAEADRAALWDACRDILEFWIAHGITTFRVDNPHTKPFAFWAWLIDGVRAAHTDVVFLAEAFSRPRIMAKLAELGFTQSYTYFAWRTQKWEIEEYVDELAHGRTVDYLRPNFWPNTPDILAGPLRNGPPSAFRSRLLLAATLSPAYGIYSGYELCENQPASDDNEEYFNSEKYELKSRDWDAPGSLAPFITQVNETRRRHPAFGELRTTQFHHVDNDELIAYTKVGYHDDGTRDIVLCVVNLDPWNWHEGIVSVDLGAIGLDWSASFEVVDELSGASYTWHGPDNYVRLDPSEGPGHVFTIHR
jgi:starch synthase (maltosyl-transferring)